VSIARAARGWGGGDGELWWSQPPAHGRLPRDDTATAATIDDAQGWLPHWRPRAFDDDGYLYVVDRLKELIKCCG